MSPCFIFKMWCITITTSTFNTLFINDLKYKVILNEHFIFIIWFCHRETQFISISGASALRTHVNNYPVVLTHLLLKKKRIICFFLSSLPTVNVLIFITSKWDNKLVKSSFWEDQRYDIWIFLRVFEIYLLIFWVTAFSAFIDRNHKSLLIFSNLGKLTAKMHQCVVVLEIDEEENSLLGSV